jgi:hypothetical protein
MLSGTASLSRGRSVAELASATQPRQRLACGDEEGNGVRGMSGEGVPARVELFLRRIAVIGGDGEDAVRRENGVVKTPELAVEGFDRADCGFELAGMSDHVGVGVIDDDHIVPSRGDIGEGKVGDRRCLHLRREIVGRDAPVGGNELPILTVEHIFPAAVEKLAILAKP